MPVEALNGIPIYFEVQGSGDPVLVLHGFSGCSQDWSTLTPEFRAGRQLIIPDLRGHGRSTQLDKPFRHDAAARDMIALLDHLGIETFKGLGVSGGGNVLLHLATRQPERVRAMVLVSATSYFPDQARPIMRQYPDTVTGEARKVLESRHPGGDAQIEVLIASTKAFAESYDDMNFTPPYLSIIQARTLIVQGDRDPLYPVEISVEMAKAIPRSSLWVVPNAGHGPVFGERWPEFLKTAGEFLQD
jgi:pimeloyl-ACP methyl ester carboxylesterase